MKDQKQKSHLYEVALWEPFYLFRRLQANLGGVTLIQNRDSRLKRRLGGIESASYRDTAEQYGLMTTCSLGFSPCAGGHPHRAFECTREGRFGIVARVECDGGDSAM